jgi:NAD(P)-dependent dehydrogenase (short-subunit alcohol dehydrogenase family)
MDGMADGCDTKVVFVTGASDEAVISSCKRFLEDGYSVGFTYGGDSTPRIGERDNILARHAPNMNAPELSKAVVDTAESFGGIDVLVFIRDLGERIGGEMLLDLGEDDWDNSMASVKSFFLSCKYAIPYLINSSCARVIVLPRRGADDANIAEYAADQALRAAAERAGGELSAFGIDVIYSPG